MQRFLDLIISINFSTYFSRFLRPSSGAQNCTYSVRYCQTNTAACCYRGWDGTQYNQQDAKFSRSIYFYKLLYMFQAVPPPIIRSTKLYIQHQVLSKQYCCLLLSWMRCNSICSTWAASSSTGLTIPDVVCTVLCSWWWAEEPPETCRAIYRNK